MQIIRSRKYINSLKEIVTYISKDSKSRAFDFKNQLDSSINNINDMPFSHRKSIYFENENIRDLIFKGYTIVYRVDKLLRTILIIGIKKYQDKL